MCRTSSIGLATNLHLNRKQVCIGVVQPVHKIKKYLPKPADLDK